MRCSDNTSRIAERARQHIKEGALILDTETTGLDDKAEIVEIAITDVYGTFEFSSLVKPSVSIPEGASGVHGIYDRDVEHAPNWRQVQPIVAAIVGKRHILAFNAAYDARIIAQTIHIHQSYECGRIPFGEWGCLMEAYMSFTGRIKWNKLTVAAQEIGYSADIAHRALADCKMARAVLFHMAAYQAPEQSALIETAPTANAYEDGK